MFFKISQSVKIPCIREKPRPSSKLQERNHCPPGPVQAAVVASLHPRGVGIASHVAVCAALCGQWVAGQGHVVTPTCPEPGLFCQVATAPMWRVDPTGL